MGYKMRIANRGKLSKNARNKISIHSVAKRFTPEEKRRNDELYNIRYKLGLLIAYYDSSKSSRDFVPSMYKTYGEYSLDMDKANKLLMENKKIPKELEQKLIKARIEMQNKGLYLNK